MAGRMGNERITSRNHQILGYDVEKNLLFVKGCVPGGKNGLVHLSASMKQPAVSDD
jgi:large subunit ribosomal protein L3